MTTRGKLLPWWRGTFPVVLLITLLVGYPALAHSGQIELVVTNHTDVMVDGRRGLLVTFEGLDSLAGIDIVYAKCQLGLIVDSCARGESEAFVMPVDEDGLTISLTGGREIDSSDFRDAEKFATAAAVSQSENSLAEFVMTDFVRRAVHHQRSRLHIVVFSLHARCVFSSVAHSRIPNSATGRLLIKSRNKYSSDQ